jgi:hypothetical protein
MSNPSNNFCLSDRSPTNLGRCKGNSLINVGAVTILPSLANIGCWLYR